MILDICYAFEETIKFYYIGTANFILFYNFNIFIKLDKNKLNIYVSDKVTNRY